jgi:hypothetical protein
VSTATTTQVIFEQYLRGERSLGDAADAVIAEITQAKAEGRARRDLRIEKPKGLTAALTVRAEAFFEEMNRRGRIG